MFRLEPSNAVVSNAKMTKSDGSEDFACFDVSVMNPITGGVMSGMIPNYKLRAGIGGEDNEMY